METHIYARHGARDLALDVFAPPTPNGAAVLLLHGGALLVGARQDTYRYAEALASLGFVAVPVAYSLRTQSLWPTPLDDVKAAFAWVRDNAARLRIDPAKIALEGFSAGAMLSLLAAPAVGAAAVVAFFPPIDAVRDPSHFMHLGKHLSEAEIAASAPLSAVKPGYPPTMVLHGMSDTMIPPDAALALFAQLRAVGAKADLRLYHDGQHEFSMEPSMVAPVQRDVALFLDRAIVAPDRYAQESRSTNIFLKPGPKPSLPRPIEADRG